MHYSLALHFTHWEQRNWSVAIVYVCCLMELYTRQPGSRFPVQFLLVLTAAFQSSRILLQSLLRAANCLAEAALGGPLLPFPSNQQHRQQTSPVEQWWEHSTANCWMRFTSYPVLSPWQVHLAVNPPTSYWAGASRAWSVWQQFVNPKGSGSWLYIPYWIYWSTNLSERLILTFFNWSFTWL